MSHFNLKSLSFYGVAISSVLVLFKVVSAYGETNLTAAPEIGGTYKIVETQNLPDCLANQALSLTIEQSGVYLFGNLAEQAAAEQATETKTQNNATFPLSGDFEGEDIVMSGQGNLPNCDPGLQLTVQGRREKDKLVGTMVESAGGGAAGSFTAQYQVEEKPAEGH